MAQWRPRALAAIRAIRAQGDSKTLIVETPYGNPDLLDELRPFKRRFGSIVYSVHFYEPMSYTHRAIGTYPVKRKLDANWLNSRLSSVKRYASKHDVQVFLGEFSAARYASGSSAYLSDLIDIFENAGFSWCYHIYQEADIWRIDGEREAMLRSWFLLN